MIKEFLTALVVGFLLFEFIEHVIFPLVWLFLRRRRGSQCGKEGMVGKIVKVNSWVKGEGSVLVEGELWKAKSDDPLQPEDKAFVQEVDGLVLKVGITKNINDSSA